MSSEEEQGKQTSAPAYVSYTTFRNFVDGLRQGIPSHVDRSVIPSLSGSVQAQLLSALRSLGLITEDGNVTEQLERLVNAKDQERKAVLTDILQSSYPYLFHDFDLSTAPPSQMEQRFRDYGGVSGGTTRRCILFFISAANEAGIPLSNFIKGMTQRKRSTPNGTKKKKKLVAQKAEETDDTELSGNSVKTESSQFPNGTEISWEAKLNWQQKIIEMRLSKLPPFNPEWDADVQAIWLQTLNQLSSAEDLDI